MTVDQLLLQISHFTDIAMEEFLPRRDARVLRSFTTLLTNGTFFTENQSNLLLKILQDNLEKIPHVKEELATALKNPTWSKRFRSLQVFKKLYLALDADKDPCITLEFTFSSSIRKLLQDISKQVTNLDTVTNGRLYTAELTENNIVVLVDALAPLDFVIDDKLNAYYATIKSWTKDTVVNQFHISAITNTNFEKQITDDLGRETMLSPAIITDRSKRYQYFCEDLKKTPESLTEKIATRPGTHYWVNKQEVGFGEIIQSLVDLKRFPILVVFDSYDTKHYLTELEKLVESLEDQGFYNNLGIYFRLPNTAEGKLFNQFISNKSLNTQVNKETVLVGIQNGKIPKFLIKNEWKPMCVIGIGTPLRNSKTAVYSNNCDLIITYTDKEPIVETRHQWL